MSQTKVFNPLLEDNIQKITTPGFTTYATVAAAKAGQPIGTDANLCYITEKEAFYVFCNTCTGVTDDDLVMTTGAGGSTRWEMLQKVSRSMGDTGWVNTDAAGLTVFSPTVLRLNISTAATISVKSLRFDIAVGNHDITITGAAGVKYIYFDDGSGTMKSSNDLWDFNTQVTVALVYWSGTAIVGAQTEFHGIRDTVWHHYCHTYNGTQYKSGLTFTSATPVDSPANPPDATVQYLWSGTGYIQDEDALINVGIGNWLQTLGSGLTSTTAAIIPFYYWNGSFITTMAAMSDRTPFIHAGGNTTPQWENAGVLTAAVNGDYIVYHYFASPQIGGQAIFARPHNAKFTSLILAQAARPASLTWSSYAELKHIYSAVFRVGTSGGSNFTNSPHRCKISSLQDFRNISGGPVAATNPTSHSGLSGLSDVGAHPATAIAPDTTNFNAELSASEINVQLALDRLDDYDSLLDWETGKAYRVGNIFKVTLEGFEGAWRTTTAHTASAAFTSDLANVELLSSWMGPREIIGQPYVSYFSAGQVVAFSNASGEYAKGLASDSDLAEVKGIVSGATASYFILSKTGSKVILSGGWTPVLTTGAVQFLDGTTAGAITATEPSTPSYTRLSLGQAISTVEFDVLVGQGTTVGGTNLYTTIPLNNGTATSLQTVNVAAGEGGFIEGVIKIDATTDYVTTFKVEFACPLTGTAYTCTPQYGCDALPTGSSIDITSGGVIQLTLPSIAGFSSGSARFSMQAAAVGATLPLQIPSSQITWSEPTMFRNRIINGNFDIWQRATSQTATGYGSDDRWSNNHGGSTKTHSQQIFTLGQTAVPGNPRYYSRTAVTSVAGSGNNVLKIHRLEGVKTLSGETATLSFWAKADANKNMAVEFTQSFGTGGSPSPFLSGLSVNTIALTTAWTKYTVTVTLPSISGKTLGSNNDDCVEIVFWFDAGSGFNARTNSLGQQSGTFDIAQVQLEPGTVATPFEFRPYGTELALCQRYYYRAITGTAFNQLAWCNVRTTTSHYALLPLPVALRTNAASVEWANVGIIASWGSAVIVPSSIDFANAAYGPGQTQVLLDVVTAAVGTVGQVSMLIGNNNVAGYVAVSAEL